MSAVTAPASETPRTSLSWALSDALVLTRRSLLRYFRIPSLIIFSTVQPIMFVLLFRYVFGGAIPVRGLSYVDYLMPGIFIQTAAFGSMGTAIGLADDLKKGMIDRFRSLPMARSAVLAGRVASDTANMVFQVLLMTVVGVLVGFRFHGTAVGALVGLGLVVLVGLSFSCISAFVGLLIRDPESSQAATGIWIFPLTFASGVFVPVDSMPGWLQTFARANPVTIFVQALRGLNGSGAVATPLLQSLAWIAAIVVIFGPLAVRQYRKVA
jgi:ABC-2 type transport system permease protein